jgi:hypothetical protein
MILNRIGGVGVLALEPRSGRIFRRARARLLKGIVSNGGIRCR